MKIERNIPMPESSKKLHKITATLRSMEVGDSVLITDKTTAQVTDYMKKARTTKEHQFWHFAYRKVEGGIRIWRIQ